MTPGDHHAQEQPMTIPTVAVSQSERNAAREGLLVKEKELPRARDALAADADTTADDFSDDFDVGEYFGINVFFRDGDQMYRSHFTTARAAEELSSVWALLDVTPFGRQEEFQDAPDGVPQDGTGSWVRRHDEYTPQELAGGCS
jgi:predicted dithiol-disulfide oxidoreductase (DUF899 family)